MRTLSKSKLLAFRQCPKRLWLEVHCPEFRDDSAGTLASFATGHQVGDIAHQLYDPQGTGTLLDPKVEGFPAIFSRTQELLGLRQPIFEAGFQAAGALSLADVMLPTAEAGRQVWRMVEVKSSTSVKDYHRDDAAVQAFVARRSGVDLAGIALAHIDSKWIYPGGGDYRGLLVEADLSEQSFAREAVVEGWIHEAQQIVQDKAMPDMRVGKQCGVPYECGFLKHCKSLEPQAVHPIAWIPGQLSKALKVHIETNDVQELSNVPDGMLNKQQLRVKTVTLSGQPWFDQEGAAQALSEHALPAYFMDFETIQFAVPIWAGTRPYQQIPFQFSVHRLSDTAELNQEAFLDLSGKDPSLGFAEALIAACGEQGPIFVYNAGFEKGKVSDLAERFPQLAKPLLAINERVVDLLPIARNFYYHPSQHGSWSIKAVLPTICPDLRYDALDGVQDGGMAMTAFLEAISPDSNPERKAEIERQLLSYCALDTYAMVRLWSAFTGNKLS